MQIPRHWAKASLPGEVDGRSILVTCWRGSSEGPADAQARAREAVQRAVDRLRSGQAAESYDYQSRDLREEVLEEIPGTDGTPTAILTRNRYGSVVLNAESLFFADLDLEPLSLWKRLLKLFGKAVPEPEEAAIGRLEAFCRANPRWGFRVYRTFNGLRLMAPHEPQDPVQPATRVVQEQLGSDSLFVRLCHFQKSFRARLSPKPWRIGLSRPEPFPREGFDAEDRFRQWLSGYQRASGGYATCRFLKAVGSGQVHPTLKRLIQLHDEHCKAYTDLPLA
jgi:hypothetical protein